MAGNLQKEEAVWKISAPLSIAPLIFSQLIFAHHQISRLLNFRTPLFYCKFAVFHSFEAPFFTLQLFILHELAPFNFRVG